MAENGSVYKSGFVALVGRPNVGKSTLVNAILMQKIAAVSPKPQTTRRRQLGIRTTETSQVIFMDTPGVHRPLHKLGVFMNEEAAAVLEDADVIVWLVDVSQKPNEEDQMLAELMVAIKELPPVILALNKVDLLSPDLLPQRQANYLELLPQVIPHALSARYGDGLDPLLEKILEILPEGPQYFDEGQITDLYEREIAAEFIREAALLHLRDEVPHSIAVRIDEYKERDDSGAFIAATIFVSRESHKGMVIGQKGGMLKKIGSSARQEIEVMSERKTFLELRVKVNKNWRNNPSVVHRLGYIAKK
ncbi:MAG: GTPase Era [Anaerolineaceae bacterium]|nr:GTPase Era [Anaerolineaceae bacterium]